MGRPFLLEETGADPRIPQTGRRTKGKGAEAARQETVSIEESQDPGKASPGKRPARTARPIVPGFVARPTACGKGRLESLGRFRVFPHTDDPQGANGPLPLAA